MEASNRGKTGKDRLGAYLRRIRQQPHAAAGTKRASWPMVWADGRIGNKERKRPMDWGHKLGMRRRQVQAMSQEYEPRKTAGMAGVGMTYAAAMRLLAVEADTDGAVIKQAYRRLVSRHHPDKLAGTGASEAQLREATERTRQLHQAYAKIRKRRGI